MLPSGDGVTEAMCQRAIVPSDLRRLDAMRGPVSTMVSITKTLADG
jgi:hypothetical protein